MTTLSHYLIRHHYIVINETYPSTKKSIEEISEEYIPAMVNACNTYKADSISFVTHSLGGIVLRQYLKNHKIPKLTRIVMLGPPNHGSPLADKLQHNYLFFLLTGPVGQELQTDVNCVLNQLPQQLPYQVGVIAGTYSLNPFWKLFFNEPNDGLVGVASTQMQHLKDFIVMPVSHSFLMSNQAVLNQIIHFLDSGKFIHHSFVHHS